MEQDKNKKVEWIHCNGCLQKTRHEVIAVRTLETTQDIEEGFWVDWSTTYTMLECLGCGAVVLRRRVVSTDLRSDDTTFFPPPISRQIPRWYFELPDNFREILNESYIAIHSGSNRMSIMGARLLLDLYMNITVGDIGGFQKKINKLVEGGHLSKNNRDLLETALEAGHAVIHRGHKPEASDVSLVFDIVENLLQTMVLEKESQNLKNRTPKRKTRN